MHAWIKVGKRLLDEETGVTAIEYALVGSVVSIAIVGAVLALSGSVSDLFQRVADRIAAALA